MSRTSNHPARACGRIFVCLLLMLSAGLGCMMKKPWRSYEQQPFDSQKWRDGDAIERGTMFGDLYKNRILNGKTKEGVVALLGEPDKKNVR